MAYRLKLVDGWGQDMQKNKGAKMLGYGVLYLGLTACAFAFAYMYSESENNRVMQMQNALSEVRLELLGLKRLSHQQDVMATSLSDTSRKCNDALVEVEKLQEHCALLHKDHRHLENEVVKKKPVLGFSGPLQVEILGGTPPPARKSHRQRVRK